MNLASSSYLLPARVRNQLYPVRWHSFKIATTDSKQGHKVYANLLAGLSVTAINPGLGRRYRLYPDFEGLCISGPSYWTVTRAR